MDEVRRLGDRVREVREGIGVTQAQAAEMIGVGRTYVSRLECGMVAPSYLTLVRVAHGLGVTVSELLTGV